MKPRRFAKPLAIASRFRTFFSSCWIVSSNTRRSSFNRRSATSRRSVLSSTLSAKAGRFFGVD